jgi:hypothetical protein
VSYPEKCEVLINGSQVKLENHYSKLKIDYPNAMHGIKTDKYAIQIVDKMKLFEYTDKEKIENNNITITEENSVNGKTPSNLFFKMQGILVYRGNRLIRRIERPFGSDEG